MVVFSFLLLFSNLCLAQEFPLEWWKEVPRSEAASWEILPQDAAPGEVVLSKRTELGVFSNFAATPFILDDLSFASIEGLWQSLKFPDSMNTEDPRHLVSDWKWTRAEVQNLVAFEAKRAGDEAKIIYKKHGFKLVSWKGQMFDYLDFAQGSQFHYELIFRATRAKLDQNPALWDLLLKTKCLILKPDHKPGDHEPPAYGYYEILMQLRAERNPHHCLKSL